jgi:predicted DNA-binding protein (MmcQ/YjbR family)
MQFDEFCDYCMSLPYTEETLPFGPETLVYKVKGKMYALTDVDNFESINVKCNPEQAEALREKYSAVQPGYHMNKKHWNTILMDGTISTKLIKQWIADSYKLVVASLPKATRFNTDNV